MSTFRAAREIPVPVEQVFAAFSDPERLARWWGPGGFTNTFAHCEFKAGGSWSFVMHGPYGRDYGNEIVFREIDPPNKIVFQHTSQPKYDLTITLSPCPAGTKLSWVQEFEKPEVASRLGHILRPACEQNLDRLTVEVLQRSRSPQMPS